MSFKFYPAGCSFSHYYDDDRITTLYSEILHFLQPATDSIDKYIGESRTMMGNLELGGGK